MSNYYILILEEVNMKSLIVYFSRRGENYAVGNIKEGNAKQAKTIMNAIWEGYELANNL